MCCFSQPVESVSNTNIYARASRGIGQYLVYSMQFRAKEELAMILPLPVPKGTAEDAVRFINLENYPNFFEDLRRAFPPPKAQPQGGLGASGGRGVQPQPKLKVRDVGSFTASFVPTVKDFARLDARFRLPEGTWQALPDYNDFGFAVFKLHRAAEQVHPMAFEFPRRNPNELFFPTVHIHDGKIHAAAHFDHTLYCQADEENEEQARALMQWEESSRHAGAFMQLPVQQNLMSLSHHCYRLRITGRQKNADTMI